MYFQKTCSKYLETTGLCYVRSEKADSSSRSARWIPTEAGCHFVERFCYPRESTQFPIPRAEVNRKSQSIRARPNSIPNGCLALQDHPCWLYKGSGFSRGSRLSQIYLWWGFSSIGTIAASHNQLRGHQRRRAFFWSPQEPINGGGRIYGGGLMRIPFPPVGGFTRMPAPLAHLAHMSDLCLAHVYVHARFVFDSALYFFDLPGGQVQSVATAGYSLVFKSERNCFSWPKGPREAYLLPVWKWNLVRIVSRHLLYFIQKLF